MTDQEHERPLTRRELRLQAQAAAAAAAEQHEAASQAEAQAEEPSLDRSAAEELVAEIEISPLNDDGTPRSRREIRQLREAAIAELLGPADPGPEDVEEVAPADAVLDESQPEPEPELADATESDASAVDVDAEALGGADQVDVDEQGDTAQQAEDPAAAHEAESLPEYGEPTEAYSLDEIREAEALAGEPTEALSLDDLLASDDIDVAPADNSESIAALFGDVEVDGSSDAASQDEDATGSGADDLFGQLIAAESSQYVADDAHQTSDLSGSENSGDDWLADELATASEEAQADDAWLTPDDEVVAPSETPTSGYSFPDIQPPEEWRSVFDNPSRGAEATESSTGDFDDLISRAVAQEGSTGSTGASALILPSHPETTGGLSGPLGATGELYVTGSIELPKALGETGGHSAIHDSVELDPFLTGGQAGTIHQTSDAGPVPVSALSAVSARRRPEIPVVAEPTKDRSKLPIILALTGGGLLILLVGGAVYAVSQGMFG